MGPRNNLFNSLTKDHDVSSVVEIRGSNLNPVTNLERLRFHSKVMKRLGDGDVRRSDGLGGGLRHGPFPFLKSV